MLDPYKVHPALFPAVYKDRTEQQRMALIRPLTRTRYGCEQRLPCVVRCVEGGRVIEDLRRIRNMGNPQEREVAYIHVLIIHSL